MKSRRSPRQHSVHTKHPRYSISKYLRGKLPIPATRLPQEDRVSEWGYYHGENFKGVPHRAEYTTFSIRSAVDMVNQLMAFKGKLSRVKPLYNKLFNRWEYTIYTRPASLQEIKSMVRRTGGNAFMYDGKPYIWDYRDERFVIDAHDPHLGEQAMERAAGIR